MKIEKLQSDLAALREEIEYFKERLSTEPDREVREGLSWCLMLAAAGEQQILTMIQEHKTPNGDDKP